MSGSAESGVTGRDIADVFLQALSARHAAAELLEEVAAEAACGHWPYGITGENLGMALWKVTRYGPGDPDPLVAILRGWHRAETAWNESLSSSR